MSESHSSIEHNINADDPISKNSPDVRKSNNKAECRVETVSWRERRITASILVEATEEKVWEVLTDYERLAEFIPNLVCSERIPCPFPGRIWLKQRGMQRTMYWNIEARVVLDLEELPQLETGRELRFSMVDGDFKRYEGKWYLQAGPRPQTTMLHYQVNVVPRLLFPAAFVECIIKSDLPINLYALAKRAETCLESVSTNFSARLDVPLMTSSDISLPKLEVSTASSCCVDIEKKDATSLSSQSEQNGQQMRLSTDAHGVKVHAFSLRSRENMDAFDSGASDWHRNGIGPACQLGHQCVADEIHFRRLDDLLENGGVHRQVVATITVKAPPKDVWAVLTAYENLTEFVPNLANSVVLFRENGKVRLLQEGCKCLLYMVLHARVVLDLWERPEMDITFKQVEGDFDSFQGQWTLDRFGSQHTLLKYVVDTKIRKDCLLAESIIEEVIYEDLPSNLCAIRDRVESLARNSGSFVEVSEDSAGMSTCELQEPSSSQINDPCNVMLGEFEFSVDRGADQKSPKGRTRRVYTSGLKSDFRVLEKEIKKFIAKYGQEGCMPLRNAMRRHGRIDLEKAITSMGGFQTIAARMKLSLDYDQRKPYGYWDKLQNLQNEVRAFQRVNGDELTMPTRLEMKKRGRYDLARALEKWGGVKEVASLLGLRTGRERKKARNRNPSRPKPSANNDGLEKIVGSVTSLDTTHEKQNLSKTATSSGSEGHSQQSLRKVITMPSSAFKELPRHPSDGYTPTSSDANDELPQDRSQKDINFTSDGTEDLPQHSANNQGKHKKMPFKTKVPQESSKWLALFTDSQSNCTRE